MKSSNKQQIKKPRGQKSSLVKFWERHFGFFLILEQPTSKPSTVRPSSCPEVQSRSSEDCKLNYQNYCTKLGKRDHLCPYDDICYYDGCANRCLNWKPPENVFFRDSVGVLYNEVNLQSEYIFIYFTWIFTLRNTQVTL